MRLLALRRRSRQHAPALGEAECYARLHGERNVELRLVVLEPQLPRHRVLASGETIRRNFEERLDARADDAARR